LKRTKNQIRNDVLTFLLKKLTLLFRVLKIVIDYKNYDLENSN